MAKTPALDAFAAFVVGKISAAEYVRIARENGKDHWLIQPSHHGKDCLCNGEHEGVECECDECDHYLECYPDWQLGT